MFAGGSALAAVHLHHRRSEDVDFFATREIEPTELAPVSSALETRATRVSFERVGVRTSLLLRGGTGVVGRVDFAFYPYDPVGRRTTWRGLTVDSLADMTVNKVQAILTRRQPRDFVDLYFLLREGPERDLFALLDLARAKFDVGAHPMGLAQRLLLVHELTDLPRMIRPVSLEDLVKFFDERARLLIREPSK